MVGGARPDATLTSVAWALASWLMFAAPTWQPQPPAPPTVWAQSQARSWEHCRELERSGERILLSQNFRSEERGTSSPWPDRARLCPGAPAVLVTAAMFEALQAPPFPPLSELAAEVAKLGETQQASRRRALQWLAAARVEAQRRRATPPPLTWYMTAYAALGAGDAALARQALRAADDRGEVEAWRLDRLGALAALLAGDLDEAVALAHRARELGTLADRGISTLILALVYDRAGAPEAAQRELASLRSMAYGYERNAIDSLLPIHERIYLMGIEQIALRNPGNATWLLKAYLACPEVQAPERVLALRRLEELRPR